MPIAGLRDIQTGIKVQEVPISRNVCTKMAVRGQTKPHKPYHSKNHVRQVLVSPPLEIAVLKVAAVKALIDTRLGFGKVGQCAVERRDVAP